MNALRSLSLIRSMPRLLNIFSCVSYSYIVAISSHVSGRLPSMQSDAALQIPSVSCSLRRRAPCKNAGSVGVGAGVGAGVSRSRCGASLAMLLSCLHSRPSLVEISSGAHGSQEVSVMSSLWYTSLWRKPHVLHAARVSLENFPSGHWWQPVLLSYGWNLPRGHAAQLMMYTLAVPLLLPAPHASLSLLQ